MKRIVSALLCVALVVCVFAGCGKKDNGIKKGDGSTITIGLCTKALVEDYDNNALTKWLEEESGYNIEFMYFSSNGNDAKSQIATMMAGGEKLPDILLGIGLGTEVYTEYGDDGYFRDLKEYFDDEEKSKIFWDRFEKLPELDQESYRCQLSNPESGAMYAFPRLETSDIDIMDYTMYINQKWLKKLNLAVPTNMAELEKVLKAFKDNDCNGNGNATDEIPLIGSVGSLGGDVVNWIINQYVYFTDERYFNLENGKLTVPFTSEAYRKGLIKANQLVKDGLLSSMSLTVGSKELRAMICPVTDANGKIDDAQELVGCFAGHLTLELENDNPAVYDYVPLDYWGNCLKKDNLHSFNTFITEDCENPDAAWDILMLLTTEEGSYRMRYGEKGKDWTDADKGTKSYIGRDAEIKIINNVFGQQNNSIWCIVAATILINSENEVTQVEDASEWMTYRNKIFGEAHDKYMAAAEKNNPKELLPIIVYTTEEKEQYDMIMSNCKSVVNTARSAFVSGTQDPSNDAQWNKYKSDLEAQGLKDWHALAQKAYDRQLKK